MIIGIDASRANRKFKTGTEWYGYYLIRRFAKYDDKNQYIIYSDVPLVRGLADLTTPFGKYDYPENEKIEYDKDGYQILKSPYNNFKGKILNWPIKYFWTQGRMALEMLLSKPDILFIPSHTMPIFHPKKTLITIHDIGFEVDRRLYSKEEMGPSGYYKRKFLNFLIKFITFGKYGSNTLDYLIWSTRYALKTAKKIITVSAFTKNEIKRIYNIGEEKISVIYNGYNESLYLYENNREKVNEILLKYGINFPYIFYVGRLNKKKNISSLIEAFSIMKEKNKDIKHKLILIGAASFGYDEINYSIREFNLDKEVIFTGWVPESDLPAFYNGATAFIFPSRYEGFGIPLLQAMACKVPIAASNSSSIPEVVGNAGLLFNPNFVQSMAIAMEEIIKNENLRNDLIKKGDERIKNFSWEKCARQTLELINSL